MLLPNFAQDVTKLRWTKGVYVTISRDFNGDFRATGDGVTTFDDSLIQDVINYVQSQGGGTVFLKAGTYYLNATILISAPNVRIIGENNATRLYCVSDYGDVFQCFNPNEVGLNNFPGPVTCALTPSGQNFGFLNGGGLLSSNWNHMVGIKFKDLAFVSAVNRVNAFDGTISGNVQDPTTVGSVLNGTYTYSATGFNGAGWYDPLGIFQISYGNPGDGNKWFGTSSAGDPDTPGNSITLTTGFSEGSGTITSPFGTYSDNTVVSDGGGGTVSYNGHNFSRVFNVSASPAYVRGGAAIYACGAVGIEVSGCSFCLSTTWNPSGGAQTGGFSDGGQFLNCCYFESCDGFCVHDPWACFTGIGVYAGNCNTGVIDGNALLMNGQTTGPAYTGTGVYLDGQPNGTTAAILVDVSEYFGLAYGLQSVQNGGVSYAHDIRGGFADSNSQFGFSLNGDSKTKISDVWTAGSGVAGIQLKNCANCSISDSNQYSDALACKILTSSAITLGDNNWQQNIFSDGTSAVNVNGGSAGSGSSTSAANISYTGVAGMNDAKTTLTPVGTGHAGEVDCYEPSQSIGYKKVVLYFNGYTKGASQNDVYTFPTPFAHTPTVNLNGLTVANTTTTTSFTITAAAAQTGFVVLEGF